MKVLRDYQLKAVNDLQAALMAGHRRPVLVQPTGSGKTLTAAEICRRTVAKGKRAIFIAPRRKLVFQTQKSFMEHGLDVGLIIAGTIPRYHAPVLVASAGTLLSRMDEGLPPVDLVLYDEVHESTNGAVKRLIEAFGCRAVGLTATPARNDGTGLGEVFDTMVMGVTVAHLTELGHLVPLQYAAPSEPDLRNIKIRAGEYDQKQAGERMAPLIGDIVLNWKRLASHRKTVVFNVTVSNAVATCDAFRNAGVSSEWVSGETPEDEQERIFARHASGETQVLCNAQLLSFGWDSPSVDCCVLAKPTRSIPNYLQMAGRVLRPFPGKYDSLLIDHAGVVDRLGFVDDDFAWSLDGKEAACENRSRSARKQQQPLTCGKCKMVYKPQRKCPFCGAEGHAKPKAPDVIEAILQMVDREPKLINATTGRALPEWMRDRTAVWEQICTIALHKKDGNVERASKLAHGQYRGFYGDWPSGSFVNNPDGRVDPRLESKCHDAMMQYFKRNKLQKKAA